MMPGDLVEALQAKQAGRAGVDVRCYGLCERVFASLQLERDQGLKFSVSPSERLDVQVGHHVLLFSRAAETGKIAAQRKPATIIDVHARACERRAWRARGVDVVVADVYPHVHFEDAREDRDFLFRDALLVESQSRIVRDGVRRWHDVYEV